MTQPDYHQPVNMQERSWVFHILGLLLAIILIAALHGSVAASQPKNACERGDGYQRECALVMAIDYLRDRSASDVELHYLRTAQEEYLRELLGRFDRKTFVLPMAPAPLDDLELWLEAVNGEFRFDKEMMVKEEIGSVRIVLGDTLIATIDGNMVRVYTHYQGIHNASILRDCSAMITWRFNPAKVFECPMVEVEIRRIISGARARRTLSPLGLVLTDWEEVTLETP